MIEIIQKENPILRAQAQPIKLEDITSDHIQKILTDMEEAMLSQDDAVAIAAPQIGVSLRIFLITKNIDAILEETEYVTQKKKVQHLVFINPKIVKKSKKTQRLEEGCLSVRWMYGFVERAEKTTVEAYDASGKKFTIGASGLLSQIFQHEIDHLNGTLFIDTADNVHDMPPEEHA